MSVKDLKAGFVSVMAPETADLPEEDEVPDFGRYNRTAHLISDLLDDILISGYIVPHMGNYQQVDSVDIMTPAELIVYRSQLPKAAQDLPFATDEQAHHPMEDYYFMIDGLGDDDSVKITLCPQDVDQNPIDQDDMNPILKKACAEFFHDLSLATSSVSGVKVNTHELSIEASNPLALVELIRNAIGWRNIENDEVCEALKTDESNPNFPIEFRSLPMPPSHGLEEDGDMNDADMHRGSKRNLGHNLLLGEEPDERVFSAMPNRVYISTDDACLAAARLDERIDNDATLCQIDEIEAIIRQEMYGKKSAPSNPLLNLH